MQGPAAQEPHTAQAIESGASFMAAVTDATAPMPGMEGDPSQAQQVRTVCIGLAAGRDRAALERIPTTVASWAQTYTWVGQNASVYVTTMQVSTLVSLPNRFNSQSFFANLSRGCAAGSFAGWHGHGGPP